MALFRDRRGFPRWSFIDSRNLPRPRHAKDDRATDPESASPASVAPDEPAAVPVVKIHVALDDVLSRDSAAASQPVPVTPPPASWQSPVESTTPAEELGPQFLDSADSPESSDSAADADPVEMARFADQATEYWLAERQAWFAESGDWPTEASDESVQLAATHPTRPYVAPDYPGLPAQSPAEVRARHGRGFSTHRRRRRRRHHGHEVETRRIDIDLVALDAALDATESQVGRGLVDLVVWHTTTGLPLAARGVDPVTGTLWHQASRDVRASLPYADLPELGTYHLVGLVDRRLAVLVHAGVDLGACVTVDLSTVSVNDLMATAIPQLHDSLVAASREY